MLIIFTGNGKGKTTAALGQAMRAVGEGKKVLMVQFIKGPWKSGEDKVQILGEGGAFKLVKMGKGFVGIMGDNLPRSEHEKAAAEAMEFTSQEIESGKWNLVILDEINNAVALNLISKTKVLDFIKKTKNKLEDLILTGRDAPSEFLAEADLITEMREQKHPYEKGLKGRRGLEY